MMRMRNVVPARSYLEAAGVILALRQRISLKSLRRPIGCSSRLGDVAAKREACETERVYDTALVLTAEREYVWFLHIHHIVVDGAAVQILLRRVTELYTDPFRASDTAPRFADCAATACGANASRRSVRVRGSSRRSGQDPGRACRARRHLSLILASVAFGGWPPRVLGALICWSIKTALDF